MKTPGHVMILASAGSGKTFALTDRFVALLAHGAAPERIAALTFTRKAAGEFFDEILRKLADAATTEKTAKELAARVGAPELTRGDFLKMLRAVIEAMHRLSLGTLDSFFARVVRAFPFELGLGGDFEVLQEHAARLERRRVLRRMFAHAGAAPDAAQQDFIEAFKRATFGREEKRLGETLDRFLDEHADAFLAAPETMQWGRAEKIWPAGAPWFAHATAKERDAAAAALQAALPWSELSDKQRARWELFFAELPVWSPGAELPKPVAYILGNALEAWPELAELVVERKKVSLPETAGNALRRLIGGIVGAELVRRLEMTRGVFEVLRGYDAVYDGTVRRSGRLTFSDVQRLLQPVRLTGGGIRAESLERANEARLLIDWRLDAQIEHWLLDEFQDTSFGQWSVLRNLVDEAVQDATGARTFFCVGDVKQAIYAWREGDSRLFREILAHYNAGEPGTIAVEPLNASWRSGPPIIAMINRVFGDAQALRALFPAEAAQRWSEEWGAHSSAKPELGGFAELRHADNEAGRFAETLRVIEAVQPLARGLSVAVLVQKNDTAASLADFLRREGKLPAVAESDLRVGTDNPLTCALLALVQVAAHPGDTAAWEHVRMTPLAEVLAAEGALNRDAVTAQLLGEIHAHGFEQTIETWLGKLAPRLARDDDFSRERGRQLAEAARLFDETGSRDAAEFVQFVARHTVRDTDTAAVIRVMTVHKSKGLGFDLVILPDLEGKSLAVRRRGLAVKKAADRSIDWIFDLPGEDFFARDEVLAAHAAAAEADACYEKLCLLYVAMTRAKRAMYVITQPIGKSVSKNFPRLLRDTLGEEWTAGEAQWFKEIPILTSSARVVPALPVLKIAEPPRPARRPARTPSQLKQTGMTGAGRFAFGDREAGAEFGDAVHVLLAEVEWLTPGEEGKWAEAWAKRGIDAAARQEALACLTAAGLAELWRAAGGVEVWRERAFEIVLDGVWMTGRLDRVIVERAAGGRPVRATIFDFKTDRVAGDLSVAAEVHAGQMNAYRRVVAKLTGLSEAAIGAEVVFTRVGRRVAVRIIRQKF